MSSKVTAGLKKLTINSGNKDGKKKKIVKKKAKKDSGKSKEEVKQARRRLSVVAGSANAPLETLDGESEAPTTNVASQAGSTKSKRCAYTKFASLSKVGYVPFNPGKVNQDRALEKISFLDQDHKAIFGVFDGHGALGHGVSEFISKSLPSTVSAQKNLEKTPEKALRRAFDDLNVKLTEESGVDCSGCGITKNVVVLDGSTLYCCNTGDSRAVLGRQKGNRVSAIDLSDDQKPERPDERKRIIAAGGRVEACKGANGEDIGPARVWLLKQDVPGLAMTRSFGDLIAGTVGVIPTPEVKKLELTKDDRYMILASDGVWEFIESSEAVDMIKNCDSPKKACEILVTEATRRWEEEEEVIDDITAQVVFFDVA